MDNGEIATLAHASKFFQPYFKQALRTLLRPQF
jgi:hypothetical protein